MSRDIALYAAIVVSFAAWITVHVLTAGAFFLSARKKLAVIALLVPVAAPWVALRHRQRALGVAWLVCAALYVALLAASRP